MNDTPRMKAANMAAMEHSTGDVWRVGCDIERQLNAANDRIKRMEEAGNDLHDGWRGNRNNKDKYFEAWLRAKEAKP